MKVADLNSNEDEFQLAVFLLSGVSANEIEVELRRYLRKIPKGERKDAMVRFVGQLAQFVARISTAAAGVGMTLPDLLEADASQHPRRLKAVPVPKAE